MMKIITLIAFVGLMIPNMSFAADEKKDEIKVLQIKGYKYLDETKRCLSMSRVRSTRILDDRHILFIGSSRKHTYVNKLRRKCPRLKGYGGFGYRLRMGSLCRGDLFTAFDSGMGMEGPTCSFGDFIRLEKLPKKSKENKEVRAKNSDVQVEHTNFKQ